MAKAKQHAAEISSTRPTPSDSGDEWPPALLELSKLAATVTRDALPDFVFRVVVFFASENEPRGDYIIHQSLELLQVSCEPFHEGNIKSALRQLCESNRVTCFKVPQKLVFGAPPMRVSIGRPETSWYDYDFIPNLTSKVEGSDETKTPQTPLKADDETDISIRPQLVEEDWMSDYQAFNFAEMEKETGISDSWLQERHARTFVDNKAVTRRFEGRLYWLKKWYFANRKTST